MRRFILHGFSRLDLTGRNIEWSTPKGVLHHTAITFLQTHGFVKKITEECDTGIPGIGVLKNEIEYVSESELRKWANAGFPARKFKHEYLADRHRPVSRTILERLCYAFGLSKENLPAKKVKRCPHCGEVIP